MTAIGGGGYQMPSGMAMDGMDAMAYPGRVTGKMVFAERASSGACGGVCGGVWWCVVVCGRGSRPGMADLMGVGIGSQPATEKVKWRCGRRTRHTLSLVHTMQLPALLAVEDVHYLCIHAIPRYTLFVTTWNTI
jgi:hypothetical protein